MIKYLLYGLIVLFFSNAMQVDKFKTVSLFNNEVSIDVPFSWQYKDKYRKYSNYQIKYDAKISHPKSKSFLTIDVYDSSHMYSTPITKELLDSFKDVQLKTKGKSVKFIENEVIKVDGHDVGILRYTFETNKNKTCFGSQLFFRTSVNSFYEIEIYSLSKPASLFKETTEQIIKSLHFKKD